MIVLTWLALLASPASFPDRCDRLKVFYSRRTWQRGAIS